MCSVAAVLLLIIGIMNVSNYLQISESADVVMQILVDNDGEFPATAFPSDRNMTAEAPFEARYFSVRVDAVTNENKYNMLKIAAVTTQKAAEYVAYISSHGLTDGMIDGYRYRVKTTTEGDTLYIFLDVNDDLNTFRTFLFGSLTIGTAGLVVVFILIYFLSKWVLKPVEESYHKQKAFITNVSHDIKTPLTVIGAEADVIDMEYGENEYTDEIKTQVEKLTGLTEKLIFLSRMEETEKTVLTDLNISELATDVIKPYYTEAKAKNLTLEEDIQPDVIIKGNEELMRRLFALILDNAMKYTTDPGIIKIRLKKQKQCSITFYNTCAGMQAGNHDEFFERFYRGDKSRCGSTPGNGIGLSVAKLIAEMNNAQITAESDKNDEIVFKVTF